MTKLTDVQKSYIKDRQALIVKLYNELDETLFEMLEALGRVDRTSLHLEDVLADFYDWLDGEQLTDNIEGQSSNEFVKGKMKSWKDLPWISARQILELRVSSKAQVLQRLDQISNELNGKEVDVPDCG